MALTLALFQASGNTLRERVLLNNKHRGIQIQSANSLKKRGCNPSGPGVLSGLSFFRILDILLSVISSFGMLYKIPGVKFHAEVR